MSSSTTDTGLADYPYFNYPGDNRIQGIRLKTYIGLDLGQKQDFSTVAIVESHEITYAARNCVTYEHLTEVQTAITHLERMPLRTPYPEIVDRVCATLSAASAHTMNTPKLIVDGTGVDTPVVDLFRARGIRRDLIPVTITSGYSETRSAAGVVGVPKRNLITGLQVAFESEELALASGIGPAIEILISELMAMRCEITENGHERFGVWRSGMHDDLVLATALAWWGANRHKNEPEIFGRRRLI